MQYFSKITGIKIMSRQELVDARDNLANIIVQLERQGDFDAHAPVIRQIAQTTLIILDDLLLKHRM